MTGYDFITELYCRVDEVLHDAPKDRQAVKITYMLSMLACSFRAFCTWQSSL